MAAEEWTNIYTSFSAGSGGPEAWYLGVKWENGLIKWRDMVSSTKKPYDTVICEASPDWFEKLNKEWKFVSILPNGQPSYMNQKKFNAIYSWYKKEIEGKFYPLQQSTEKNVKKIKGSLTKSQILQKIFEDD